MNTGDTAWLLVSAALVMFMTPGLALFYGGMVRRKNVLGTIVQSLILIGLISVQWALVGYSLAFGPDHRRHHRRPLLVRALRGRARAARTTRRRFPTRPSWSTR